MLSRKFVALGGALGLGVVVLLGTPAQANTRPVIQQLPMPASGLCTDVSAPTSLNIGGAASGGWTRQWASWENSGRGGFVCGQTLVFNNTLTNTACSPDCSRQPQANSHDCEQPISVTPSGHGFAVR